MSSEVKAMDKLKLCPMCGEDVSSVIFDFDKMGNGGFQIICAPLYGGCGLMTRLYSTEQEAINSWNRRVSNE